MSRNLQKIGKVVKAKGYPWAKATWEPIGPSIEMIGREGGWTVMVGQDGNGSDNDDQIYDYLFGFNIEEVMEQVKRLPQWEPS